MGKDHDNEAVTSWFHVDKGLFFRRLEDGSVEIGTGPDFNSVAPLQVIEPSSWASVISGMSARGENHITYQEAVEFHERID